MAAKQPVPTPRYFIQHSRYKKQVGWRLKDLSLSLNGNIAVTGHNNLTRRACIDVYTNVRHSDSRDKPKILYSKEFEKYTAEDGWGWWGRRALFYPGSDTKILSGLGSKLEVTDIIQDRVIKSRQINLVKHANLHSEITGLSVRETEIFISLHQSKIIIVHDVIKLNEIKSIVLHGIQDGYYPNDMATIADRIFVCVGEDKEESNDKLLVFEETNGRLLSELTKPTYTVQWYVWSLALNMKLNVLAVAWSQTFIGASKGIDVIVFHSLLSENNCSFLRVEAEFCVYRIRISDRGDRMITGNEWSGEVKVFDMAEFLTYHQLKTNLASQLQVDDCISLINYFALPKDQSEAIMNSGLSTEYLLSILEEIGVLQPSNIDRLIEAFKDLNICSSCYHLVDFYKRTRMQATSYDKFLATLSAHLVAPLPNILCDYFNITDDKKTSILSSQNPGLSLLLSLDQIGKIMQFEVADLKPPFSQMKLVQAVAMINEYQSKVEEEKITLLGDITDERKREIFVQCVQRKIKSWYETMTPVPWRKSCQWSASDLFVGSGLILTDSKSKRSLLGVDEKCKVESKEIFSHKRLKYETRIVLEGDPGCGKTMLMSQLAYDWSQGKLNSIKLLVLLPLKFVQQRTLVEAIKEFYIPENKYLSISDIEKILDNKENPAHLLLDGLEEYSGKPKQGKSEVREIMTRKKYPACKVLISSRSDFAKDLPKIPMLKLGRFGDKERTSYIEKVFPDNSKKQLETMQIMANSPIIQDLCSVPLLFVLAVHNVENMRKTKIGQIDRMAPFVKGMLDTLCPVESLITKTQELVLEGQVQKKTSLEEIAFNGLCRESQQLYWQKDFYDEKIQNSKEWIDSGVLVIEESSSSVPIDKKDHHEQSANTEASDLNVSTEEDNSQPSGLGKVAEGQSDVGMKKSRVREDSDKHSDTDKHVPLQVRFLHKIFQEWFAAKYISSKISRVKLDHSEKCLYECLALINPADLHHVLRFTCALHPPSCHIIIKHLLRYRTKEGDVPQYIMNCIFLCLAEYTGDYNPVILDILSEICLENIMIHGDDSRLLQQSKVMLLKVASSHQIKTRKLLLVDLVVSAEGDVLRFNSGIMMIVVETLEVIELSRWDQTLKEEDYSNILNFIAKFPILRKASLKFPDEPPRVDKGTAVSLQENDLTVMWIIGSKLRLVLNHATGKWELLGEIPPGEQKQDEEADFHCLLEAKATITNNGGVLEIRNTNVSLTIPPDCLPENMEHCEMQLRIIPRETIKERVTSSPLNSSIVVELLPNSLKFRQPVRLTIPHCWLLRDAGERKAMIYISHQRPGEPQWEEQTHISYHLEETACIIMLNSFCLVKFSVDSEIVEAIKLIVYTAARNLQPVDKVADIHVGYYWDSPDERMVAHRVRDLIVAHRKSFFFFVRKGKRHPLRISLDNIFPSNWYYHSKMPSARELSYEQVASLTRNVVVYTLIKENNIPQNPLCVFTVSQDSGQIAVQLASHLKMTDTQPLSAGHVESAVESLDRYGAPLNAEMTVTRAGGTLRIKGSMVKLEIPPDAIPTQKKECLIRMTINPTRVVEDQVPFFCSNSCTAVDISPSNLTLRYPAKLTLPHCLKLEEKEGQKARIFFNEEEGTPSPWREQQNLEHELNDSSCIMHLEKLCCVKYSIDESIVKGKRIMLYSAAQSVKQEDRLAYADIGYYSDIPQGGELLQLNPNLEIDSETEVLFMEEQKFGLKLLLDCVIPSEWNYCVPNENPQEIPYNVIASSIEHSHLYVLQKEKDYPGSVICKFVASQKNTHMSSELSLRIRPQQDQPKGTNQAEQRVTKADPIIATIKRLSKKLGNSWKFVGRNLGLDDTVLDDIEKTYTGTREHSYQMLMQWKQNSGSDATHAKLIQALLEDDRKDLADDVKTWTEQQNA